MTSAANGKGLEALLARVSTALRSGAQTERLDLPQSAGKARSWLYERRLVEAETLEDGRMIFDVRWDAAERGQFFSSFNQAFDKAAGLTE